jgi:hypothetical protein
MRKEELAIALKLTVVIPDLMTVIVSMESKLELIEVEALRLFCVALCLLSLANHSIVHELVSFQIRNEKARAWAHASDSVVNLLLFDQRFACRRFLLSMLSIARIERQVN